jgi:Lhr-like helicase
MAIGTITSDPSIQVNYLRGATLGSINESFISRLSPGDKFIFAGRVLELVRMRDMTAYVRQARSREGAIPRWTGTTLPLSAELAAAVRQKLDDAHHGVFADPEMWAVRPILSLQQKWSRIPEADEVLVERVKTRDGYHIFIYPFAGKLVHQGLAALFAYRIARLQPITFTLTANDYGLELLAAEPAPLDAALAGTSTGSSLSFRQRTSSKISLPASMPARWRAGSSARLPVSPVSSSRVFPDSRAAPSSFRRPAACSSTSSANMTPITCCWPKPTAKCWSASLNKAG